MVKPFKMAKAPELFEEVWVVIDVLERLGGELEITAEPRRPRVDHVSSEGVIYGGIDPWGSVRVPAFKGKVNEQIYVKPRGSHATRITDMPEPMHSKIMNQINTWLAE